MDDLGQFLRLDGLELLAAGFQFFEGLDDGLSHATVGLVGSANNGEFIRSGETFVSIFVIEANAQKVGRLWLAAAGYFLHRMRLRWSPRPWFQERFASRQCKECR